MSFNFFGFNIGANDNVEIPVLFPIDMTRIDFIRIDTVSIYTKILTDVIERIHGIDESVEDLLWDNCLQSESSYGLITRIAMAMADQRDLFLVYEKALSIIRIATGEEQAQIRKDYEKSGESKAGVFVSFTKYHRTQMVKLYSALEYFTVGALNKSMNLSNAIQIKMSDIRSSTGLTDSALVTAQAVKAANSLIAGKGILIDAKDMIETAKVDLTSTEAVMQFINEKRAFYLGLPESYICGEQTGGLGSTGENDTKATERGLKNYYSAIMKPVLEALFDSKISYKSQDFRQIDSGVNALKIFELTDESLITNDNKKKIIEGLFGIDPDDNLDTTDPLPPMPPVDPNAPPVPPAVPPKPAPGAKP